MAKVSDCICGLASSSSTAASSMAAATCRSLGARSESGGLRAAAAGFSNSRRQQRWGPREIRVLEECLSFADRRGAESVTRGMQTKPARLVSGVVESGSLRRGGGAKPAASSVGGCWRERWWNGEASVHVVEGGGSMCAKIGWRRRDRRWPRRHGLLAPILVADSGVDGKGRSRERTMSHRRDVILPRAMEAARADMATVDSPLEADQEDLRRYQDEDDLAQEGVEGSSADVAYAVEEEEAGYMPQAGDEVMGVVVAIDERGVDIDIGARRFGRLPLKEYVTPNLYAHQLSVWHRAKSTDDDDVSSSEDDTSAASVASSSSTEEVSSVNGVVSNDVSEGAVSAGAETEAGAGEGAEAGAGAEESGVTQSSKPLPEMAIEVGMELPFVVLGESISGRPLLSARTFAERIAWERIQQLAEVREPVEVVALDWNRGGIVSNVEGIRAFIPIPHLVTGRTGANDLQSLVGTKLYVQVIEFDQQAKEVIISEKRGKIQRELIANQPGTLVEGVVKKITSYGAFVDIDDTLLRGLLHISRISRMHVSEVEDVFSVGDRILAIVVSSEPSSGRIALSTKELESEDGLILREKQRVFAEAPQMVAHYKQRLEDEEMYMEDVRDTR